MVKPNALPTYSKDSVLYADEGLSDLTPIGVIVSSGTLISGALTFDSLVGDLDTASGAFSQSLTVSGIPVDLSAAGGPGAGVSSLNGKQGAITLQGQGGTTVNTAGTTITISGGSGGTNDHSSLSNLDFASSGHTGFASSTALTTTSGHLQTQIDGIDNHSRYTDAEAVSGTESARVTLSGHLQSEIDLNASAILQLDNELGALDSELVTVSGHLQNQIDNLPASSGTVAFVNALQGSDGITVISGSDVDTIQGFRGEFVAASGSLQGQIDAIDTGSSTGGKALLGSDGITVTSGANTIDISGFETEFVSASGTLQTQIDDNSSNISDNTNLIVTTSGHLQNQIISIDVDEIEPAIVGDGGITVASGSNTTISGFRGEFVTASGSLQNQIDTKTDQAEFVSASGSLQSQIDSIDTGSSTGGKALVGSDGITIISGSNDINVQGFRGEFVAASGSLQSQINTNSTDIVDNTSLVTTTSGHLQSQIDSIDVSGSDTDTALVGSDGITVISGSNTIDIQGFRTEFVSASGSIQDQIDNLDDTFATDAQLTSVSGHLQSQIVGSSDLQAAYDTGDGIITTTSGKPFELDGNGELVAVTGTFTQGLTIGTNSVDIDEDTVSINGDRVIVEPEFVSASGHLNSRITSMDPNGISFKGALVTKSSNQNMPNGNETPVTFDSVVYDHGGWYSASFPSRLTVPPGVSRIVAFGNVSIENSGATGKQQIKMLLNGNNLIVGLPIAGHAQEISSSDDLYNVRSAPIEVTPGDYIELSVFHDQGGGIVTFGSNNTWFGIAADRTGFEIPLVGAGDITVISGTDIITISGSSSSDDLVAASGTFTGGVTISGGLTTLGRVNLGDPGHEDASVPWRGSVFDAIAKVNDFGGNRDALLTLHRHSTVDGANLLLTRTKTNDETHAALANGDEVARIIFGAHDGTDYNEAARIQVTMDGAVSDNDTPGEMTFRVTPDGSNLSQTAVTISNNKDVLFSGNAVTLRNDSDAEVELLLDSGDSSAQQTDLTFADRGSNKWILRKGTGNAFVIRDATTGNNSLRLLSGNTTNNALTVNAGGQVGIAGVASGGNQLDVSGDAARIRGNNPVFRVQQESGSGTQELRFANAGSDQWTFRNDAVNNFILREAGVNNVFVVISGAGDGGEVLRIDAGGRVGIGTLTPQRKLDVASTGRFQDSLEVTTTSGEFYPPRMTTAERNNLSPSEGAVVFDTTVGELQTYDGSNWKQRSLVNVRDFGAAGDGITDDTAAIQSAMDAGEIIVVPSGVYLIDQVDVTSTVDVRCSSDAIFRQRSTGDEDIACIRFTTGSDNSTWEGGQFDGDASSHASSYTGSTETNKRVWTGIRLDGAPTNLRFRNIHTYDFLQAGFWHQNASRVVWENILIERCGKAFICQRNDEGRLANIVCNEIQNRNKAIFQHAVEIRDADNLSIFGITVLDFQPDNSGVEPTPGAIAFERMRTMTAVGLSADGFSGSGKAGVGFIIDTLENCSLSGLSCRNGYESGATINTCWDSTIDQFLFDLDYEDSLGGGAEGIRIRGGGLFPAIGTGAVSENARANEGSRNLRLSNGLVMRAANQGYLIQSGYVQLVNCHALANILHGFQSNENLTGGGTFPGAPAVPVTYLDLLGCTASYNGLAGLFIEEGEDIQIVGGSYVNNGSDTTGGNQRSGIWLSDAARVRAVDVDLGDTQTWSTKSPGASFSPGSTSGNQFELSLIRPNRVQVGQYLVFKNADGSGDVTAKVVDKRRDDIVVETSGPVTFSGTGNTSSLTGTVSTNGVSVTGAGTAFTTEITGRTYIESGGDYRRIIRVNSDTSAVLEEAFPSDLSGASVSKLEVDVDPSSTHRQQYGIRIENSASDVYTRGLFGEVANSFWNLASSASQSFSRGSEVLGTLISIASATSMSVPEIQNGFFQVTGTASIQTIPVHAAGSRITLLFSSTPDVEHLAGNISLEGSADWTTIAANDTLTLQCDGTTWFEVSRSDNS